MRGDDVVGGGGDRGSGGLQVAPLHRVLVVLIVYLALLASACASSVVGATSDDYRLDLSGLDDCPNPLVIQTDSLPQPEHGAVYNLTDGKGLIDPNTGHFTGPLAAHPSIILEIRAGGPFTDHRPTVEVMAEDDEIFLGYVNTDEAIANHSRNPATAVVAPLDINPQMLMWDPATYEIDDWLDIKKTGAPVRLVAGAPYAEYLLGTNLVLPGQVDDRYDGTPEAFIAAAGTIIQPGLATREPYYYEKVLEDWGKPVDHLLIHDSGYEIYQGALAILDQRFTNRARSCLRSFVPLVQVSIVDFQRDPSTTNSVIVQAVADLDGFWPLTEDAALETVIQMGELGIVGNGTNQTVGDFDRGRVEELIAVTVAKMESVYVPAGLGPDDLVTNEFIDENIGL